jgi:hypothetical protein
MPPFRLAEAIPVEGQLFPYNQRVLLEPQIASQVIIFII